MAIIIYESKRTVYFEKINMKNKKSKFKDILDVLSSLSPKEVEILRFAGQHEQPLCSKHNNYNN